jgi:probable LLM family oxidoreductase
MTNHFEIGLYTFAELTPDPDTGRLISPAKRIAYFLERVELAEQVGLDVIGLGEHHRPDFVSSAPEVVLAAAAARTSSIRLSSAVTVLSSDDPVRVFQRFALLDLVSNGRAEIMAGRGSFIESFPLFGYDLRDYDQLFAEKLELLLKIRESERVTWSGRHRPPLDDLGIYPRPMQEEIPIWIAVGGTPQSVVRAGTLGLHLALAIIGGMPAQFAPLKTLYRQAAAQAGHDPGKLAFSVNSHGYIADDRRRAMDEAYPYFAAVMNKIGRERGWPPMTREQFDSSCGLQGANFIGTADDVIEKILHQHEIFGHQRFLLMMGVGTMPHDKVMHAIELLGTKVAPAVRSEIARRTA